ncbi:hypothetical protein J6590_075737 [Homalodisca vitripennis]|nr:hypothetical protein J6590_075737 [Homalodisca vitripennis]
MDFDDFLSLWAAVHTRVPHDIKLYKKWTLMISCPYGLRCIHEFLTERNLGEKEWGRAEQFQQTPNMWLIIGLSSERF